MAESAALLVDEVLPMKPFRQWVLSVPFPLRWIFASNPQVMGKVLGVVTRVISGYLIKKSSNTHQTASTGAVTFIQRFGSALNLNIHFHMLFLDGVYEIDSDRCRFQEVKPPSISELNQLLHRLSERIGRLLEREGLIERDMENSYLSMDCMEDDLMSQLHGSSITYRIAMGPQQGKKVFTLQTLPCMEALESHSSALVVKGGGFSLHAGVSAKAHERTKLEHLCRYIARPGVSRQRMKLTESGKIRYELKNPYRNGTTHVIFEPLDFIARLAALVPKPRVHLTRFHGVFAPHSKYRELVTGEAKQHKRELIGVGEAKTVGEQRAAMTWAMRLKRVFNIDVMVCNRCQGAVKIIACIEDKQVIAKILSHVKQAVEHEMLGSVFNIRGAPLYTL